MKAPVDYPLNDEARTAEFSVDELMYAAFLDRQAASQPSAVPTPASPALIADLQMDESGPVVKIEPAVESASQRSFAALAQSLLAAQASQAGRPSVISRLTRSSR